MNYSNVTNPQWANAERTVIDCAVTFDDLGTVPFTANPDDAATTYGPEIFAKCVAGVYGPVAEYVPPPPAPPPTAEANKAEAERRLTATDWVNEPDVTDPTRNPHLTNYDAFLDYRSVVRRIAVYPVAGNLDWPVEPSASWSA